MTISRTRRIVLAMKLTLESSARVNVVRAYSPSELHIGEHIIRARCIVTASELITDWEPAAYAELNPVHLETILALKPDVVILGTGPTQHFPPAAIRKVFAERGVGLEVMDLGAACRTFNVLVQEERRVAAALFLT
jgi:uncharacterized protein